LLGIVEGQIRTEKGGIASKEIWSPPHESSHAEEIVGDDESKVGCEE
jgi:hypothetical protein